MTRREEFDAKLERVRRLLEAKGLGGILLARRSNFAWLAGGGENYVVSSSEIGVGSLLVTPRQVFVFSTNIEVPRFLEEELAGLPVDGLPHPWHEGADRASKDLRDVLEGGFLGGDAPGSDVDLSAAVAELRTPLLPPEIDRYRSLGEKSADLMSRVCRSLKPGDSEFEAAARIEGACTEQGLEAYVRLVAFDDRIDRWRHPIPTGKRLERRAMLVLCAREKGLIANLTRLVHLGKVPNDLRRRHEACCRVDAVLNLASRPGARLSEVFAAGVRQYQAEGYPEEWRLHHQGGTTGYEGRDAFGNPTASGEIVAPGAVAWNPSIRGTKSEDTFLVTDEGVENLCASKDWPQVHAETDLGALSRCDILEI